MKSFVGYQFEKNIDMIGHMSVEKFFVDIKFVKDSNKLTTYQNDCGKKYAIAYIDYSLYDVLEKVHFEAILSDPDTWLEQFKNINSFNCVGFIVEYCEITKTWISDTINLIEEHIRNEILPRYKGSVS